MVLQQLSFLGDTRSRRELLMFAQANPSRLPLAMGISQPSATHGRGQENEGDRCTGQDTTPTSHSSDHPHGWSDDQYFRDELLDC